MSVEEMAVLINDAEEQLMLPPCSQEHCVVYAENGICKNVNKEPCVAATVHWLNSEVQDDTVQNGLTDNRKDALLRTFLGRGGGSA